MTSERDPGKSGEIGWGRSIVGKLTMLLAVIVLSAAWATKILAATSLPATHSHPRVPRGFGAPLYNQAPSMPPPVFNPSTPYTVPTTPEVPVSPASPGSVFGNGTSP
jgi:hypothetical protein